MHDDIIKDIYHALAKERLKQFWVGVACMNVRELIPTIDTCNLLHCGVTFGCLIIANLIDLLLVQISILRLRSVVRIINYLA